MKYIVTIRNNNGGLEEYDGGDTLEAARREALFFVENTPAHVPVKICTVNKDERLVVKEVVRGGTLGAYP